MPTAVAYPNIALVKYWGKQDKPGNLPATPNLSITLDTLQTETSVAEAQGDALVLDGEQVQDAKLAAFLAELRNNFDIPQLRITSRNNFPTGAGLASSASGYAALMLAINELAELHLKAEHLSEWARRGSASAARSFYGGFVSLVPPLWRAQPAASAEHWPLSVVIAITSKDKKATPSSQGMEVSRLTSPLYETWVNTSTDDYAAANKAIEERNFIDLATVAELSCLKMHSVMLTSKPTLSYWNPATIAVMDKVRELRQDNIAAFFTIDAGPQVKVVCLPEDVEQVAAALDAIPGVLQTITCGLGPGASLR